MIELNYKQMTEAGLGKDREDDVQRYFDKCIGSNGRDTWSRSSFTLSPMQIAILDTMFDAGRDVTFKKEGLLNRSTRLAYYATKSLISSHRNVRDWISCGHDEVAYVKEWTLRKVTSFESRYEFETEEVEVTRDENRKDEWLEDLHETTMDTYELGNYDAKRMICKESNTDGNCAWESKRNEDGVRCYHHSHHPSELVLGYWEHNETGQSLYNDSMGHTTSEYTFIYHKDQDEDAILGQVADSDVLEMIRQTIPKMKTEARPWLESVSRGVYSLDWWHIIDSMIAHQGQSLYNDSMDGTVSNGWIFKTNKHYSNGTSGWWEPVNPVMMYEVYYKEYEWSSGTQMANLKYKTEEEANTIAKVLLDSMRVSRYLIEGKSRGTFYVRPVGVDNNKSPDFDPNRYTPQEFADACYEDKLDSVDNDMYHHEK